jgi:hypothetical protein
VAENFELKVKTLPPSLKNPPSLFKNSPFLLNNTPSILNSSSLHQLARSLAHPLISHIIDAIF